MKLKSKLEYWLPPALAGLLYELRALKSYQNLRPLISKNKELKDIHKGDRCFIIGSGPSIKEQNLKPLRDEIVIPVNNFYVHPDFTEIMSGSCQKYYMTAPTHAPQDRETWAKWLEEISNYVPSNTKMLFGINKYADNIKSIIDEHELFPNNEIYWYFPRANRYIEKYGFYKRYLDISYLIMNAGTVSVYALIFAIYMGFNEIYLLGIDHSHICSKLDDLSLRFYTSGLHQKDQKLAKSVDIFLKQGNTFFQYELIKSSTKSQIINLSHRSLVDTFQFEKIESIIEQ